MTLRNMQVLRVAYLMTIALFISLPREKTIATGLAPIPARDDGAYLVHTDTSLLL